MPPKTSRIPLYALIHTRRLYRDLRKIHASYMQASNLRLLQLIWKNCVPIANISMVYASNNRLPRRESTVAEKMHVYQIHWLH